MKYEPKPGSPYTTAIAETEEEAAALAWVKEHVPIFAGSETYGISGFEAGVKWAREQALLAADLSAVLDDDIGDDEGEGK